MSEATPEATAFSVILEPVGLVLGALSRGIASVPWSLVFSRLASLVVLPVKALLIPAKVLARVLFVISTPVLYPLSYLFVGVAALLRLVASLEPLYTFFGVAALIGILAGLALILTSSLLNAYMGIRERRPRKGPKKLRSSTKHDDGNQDEDVSSTPHETDWSLVHPNTSSPVRRRPAYGLLSQTIHEEEDDSL